MVIKFLMRDIRETINEFTAKKDKLKNAISGPNLMVHERAYLLLSAIFPHIFVIPKEKPFPRYYLLDMAFYAIIFIMFLGSMTYFLSKDYSCFGGEINAILKEHYGIGDPEDLRWCSMLKNISKSQDNITLILPLNGDDSYADGIRDKR